ncbi:hypothetical protein MANES_05G036950v8 [Manihot esculenta]|uniref:Uncharacterized protein n=1 Tax=Manihot esculenta TaxID=3983 RepID=A0ACB7HLT3_MANES|nr:hypothetical protein MANES_05G036950v8 [Manihot esculenta]
MAEQEAKKLEAESSVINTPATAEKPDESKALAVVETIPESASKKISKGSLDRDIALAEVEKEKKNSFIKAWEDSEKTKAENKAQKKLSYVTSWENSKKAALEAKLRKIEATNPLSLRININDSAPEKLEKKKAEYAEKMKNKVASLHKQAEEKRAMAEEMAAKYRATGQTPKKHLGCF